MNYEDGENEVRDMHPLEVRPSDGHLYVFDFDNTLVETDARVIVRHSSGDVSCMTSAEFRTYTMCEGDTIDLHEFAGDLIRPNIVGSVFDTMRDVYFRYGPQSIVILTARSWYRPVREFMRSVGLPGIFVAAVGGTDEGSTKAAKSDYISRRIVTHDLRRLDVYDDSVANLVAIGDLNTRFPDVEIVTHVVR